MESHVRNGVGAVRPYIHGPMGLVRFLEHVFGAKELERHHFDDDSAHVELQIGDSVIALEAGPLPPGVSAWINAIYVYVPDVDAATARARELGAAVFQEPEDKPYKERQAGFRDEAGNTWWLGTYRDDL